MNATPEISTGLASQSGHWYAADGSPAYEITGANGKQRPVTLRDARKFGLYPSVTTILGCAAKPGLEAWKVRQAILAALTLPRIDGETDDAFAARALEDSREQSRKAAALGTLLHEQIERSFTEPPEPDWFPFVQPVRDWLERQFPGVTWSAERSFAHPLGYGGKVDLHAPGIVLDFKTKDFDLEDAATVKAYDEHGCQLAAYQMGLGLARDGEHWPERWNLFVSTRVPGLIVPYQWDAESFDRHWEMFVCLLDYWKADKGYDPERHERAQSAA